MSRFTGAPLLFSFLLLGTPCLAQAPDRPSDREIIAELKSVRAALEKLENGQRVLMALARIQIDESRIGYLEAQRIQASIDEQKLKAEADAEATTLRRMEESAAAGLNQAVLTASGERPAGVDLAPARARLSAAVQRAGEASRARQSIDEAIAALRRRIDLLEKSLERN